MKEPRKIGLSSPEFTPVDCPTMDDRLSDEVLKSSGRLKQEKNDIHNFSINVGTISDIWNQWYHTIPLWKKILCVMIFPFFVLWFGFCRTLMQIGKGFLWLGNFLSGNAWHI